MAPHLTAIISTSEGPWWAAGALAIVGTVLKLAQVVARVRARQEAKRIEAEQASVTARAPAELEYLKGAEGIRQFLASELERRSRETAEWRIEANTWRGQVEKERMEKEQWRAAHEACEERCRDLQEQVEELKTKVAQMERAHHQDLIELRRDFDALKNRVGGRGR